MMEIKLSMEDMGTVLLKAGVIGKDVIVTGIRRTVGAVPGVRIWIEKKEDVEAEVERVSQQ